jgi:hypothetical protein
MQILKNVVFIADPFEQVLSKLSKGMSHQMDSTFVDMLRIEKREKKTARLVFESLSCSSQRRLAAVTRRSMLMALQIRRDI